MAPATDDVIVTDIDDPAAAGARPIRNLGFMGKVQAAIARYRGWNSPFKEHPAYSAAKAGDAVSALRLAAELVPPLAARARHEFGPGCTYVAPHAEEESGRNQIPLALAVTLAADTDGMYDARIVQANRAFHTGADQAERLVSRPAFSGFVVAGAQYVVVDDVTSSGSTLAELAEHVHRGGGEVVGAVVFVDASRTGRLAPDARTVRMLEARHGDVLRAEFGIDPAALTADEAKYVSGFGVADALRIRGAKARQDRVQRLDGAGVQGDEGAGRPRGG